MTSAPPYTPDSREPPALALQRLEQGAPASHRRGSCGYEFCVLAPHQSSDDAAVLAKRLIAAVAKSPVAGASSPPTSISIGVVACSEHGDQPEVMLDLADRATYAAKSTGSAMTIAPREGGSAGARE